MSTPDFSIADTSTWPVMLTPEHMAAITGRTVTAIKKACYLRRFQPVPFEKHPYRWRRADVIRYVEGARTVSLRRSA